MSLVCNPDLDNFFIAMTTDDIANPHDRLFREIWSDRAVAADFLSHYLPSNILARVDLSSIRISKDSFVESDLRAYYADILYQLSLSGRPGFIYLLFEHKSRPERWVHLQLLGYLRDIWRLHLKQQGGRRLPVIVTMLLYHGRRPWSGPSRFMDLMEPPARDLSAHVPDFEFILRDLSRFSDDEIRGAVLTRATLLLMKHIFDPDIRHKLPKVLALMRDLLQTEDGLRSIYVLLRYVMGVVDDISVDEMQGMMDEALPETEEEVIMTLAEQLRREGFEKGRQKKAKKSGQEKGLPQGLIEAIELGLTLRFGDKALELMPKVRRMRKIEKLQALKEAIKTANDLSDFKGRM